MVACRTKENGTKYSIDYPINIGLKKASSKKCSSCKDSYSNFRASYNIKLILIFIMLLFQAQINHSKEVAKEDYCIGIPCKHPKFQKRLVLPHNSQ